MDARSKYKNILHLYLEAYPHLTKANGYKAAQKLWNSVKTDEEKINKEVIRLKSKISSNKSKNLNSFFNASSAKKKKRDTEEATTTTDNSKTSEEFSAATPGLFCNLFFYIK